MNFLNFSKPVSPGDLKEVDLKKLITEVAVEMGVKIDVLLKEDASISSDRNLLYSIFSNLIINSKEANADKIEVKINKGNSGEYILLFKDNGNGIKNISGDKIWYPFYTSKEKGTGMGLAIVKKVVSFLNGEITLAGSGEDGALFKIVFYKIEAP